MDPRLHFVTVATADLDAVRAFYRQGLGWEPLADVPGEIIFFQVGPGLVLGFYEQSAFAADVGRPPGSTGHGGLALSHNVDEESAVDRVVDALLAAGATSLTEPRHAAFGGYHAHVADPNGLVWEIAFNPGWSVDDDGTVRLNT